MTDEAKLRSIYDVLHAIHDQCEDEGDRIYLGSTNDRHTMLRQLRHMEKLIPAAMLYPDAFMTPEPAQPAESPEARARCLTPGCKFVTEVKTSYAHSSYGNARLSVTVLLPTWKSLKAQSTTETKHIENILHRYMEQAVAEIGQYDLSLGGDVAKDWPATTARPTERGAVEALQKRIAWCNDDTGSNMPVSNDVEVSVPLGEIRAAIAALTPPVTVAATDSRITKDWCLNMARLEAGQEIGAGMPHHPLRAPEVAATDQAAEVSWARSQALWDAAKECIRVKDETTFADSVSEEYREGYKAACVIASMPLQAMSRRAAPDWSGTSGDTAPATDQAGEVERRARVIAAMNPHGWLGEQCVTDILAALDTQPATGRTMGGEDKLRAAIQLALQCTPYVAMGSEQYEVGYDCGDPWEILRTALQEPRP